MKKNLALAVCCAAAMSLLLLAGCSSGGHQVLDMGEQCITCHSDTRTTYDVADPKGAVEVGTTFTVKTSADEITLCTVNFIAEDGSKVVPVRYQDVKVSDGVAEVTAKEGVWAVAIDNGDSSKYQVIVVNSAIDGGEIQL